MARPMAISIAAALGMAAIAQAAAQSVDQIADSAGTSRVAAPAPVSVNQTPSVETPQLSGKAASSGGAPQISSPGDRPGPQQLYRGPRTANGPEPLSRREDGRATAIVHIEGQDRCDPEAKAAQADATCSHVIESRAAEFAQPDRSRLSPEQRLLAEQQPAEGGSLQSVRRLANSSGNPDVLDDQAIASVALRRDPPVARAAEKAEEASPTSAAAALIADIVTRAAQGPQ